MEKGQVVAGVAQQQRPLLPDQHDQTAPGVAGQIVNVDMQPAQIKAVAAAHLADLLQGLGRNDLRFLHRLGAQEQPALPEAHVRVLAVLEDLYLGDIRPSGRSFKRNSQYAKALDEVVKAGDALTDNLAEEQKELFFVITLYDGITLMLSELGVTDELSESQIRPFMVPYVFEREHYCAPDWAKNFVWYQIFPDRFAGEGDPVAFAPTRDNFFGGTMKGITGKIPYLKNLGVQGIYLNPIFQSPSNHRFDTADYAQIDSLLGDEKDFRQLVESLHEAGLRIMLDGVFNHCAWDHPFWQDVLHNGESSPCYEWFYIEDVRSLTGAEKEKFPPEIIKREHPFACFAFAANMPKWNTENELVMDYLIGQAVHWTRDYGIDAWHLDVPDEISMRFLREFKRRIRAVSDQVYIIGEIWQDAGLWLDHSVFDGTMDYPLFGTVVVRE